MENQPPKQIQPFSQPPTANPAQSPVGSLGFAGNGPKSESARNKSKLDPASTQGSLQLSEIKNNLIIMNDGSFRAVVACQSINFDLMSDREREAIEYAYQNFLNSLNFMIQILVRSRRIDIGPYIEKLITIRQKTDNLLLGSLMENYIDYIDTLAGSANIMEKNFYVIVPFSESGDAQNLIKQGKGFFELLFKRKPEFEVTRISSIAFEKAKSELANRVNVIVSGLSKLGIRCSQLDSNQISELIYGFYNPDKNISQPLLNIINPAGLFVSNIDDKNYTNRPNPGGQL